jgi:hypothetical protein
LEGAGRGRRLQRGTGWVVNLRGCYLT